MLYVSKIDHTPPINHGWYNKWLVSCLIIQDSMNTFKDVEKIIYYYHEYIQRLQCISLLTKCATAGERSLGAANLNKK